MKIIGKAYKENLAIGIPMAVISVMLLVAIGIIIFDTTFLRIVVSSVIFATATVCLIYFTILVVLQLLAKENIILYDEDKKLFTVNCYRHTEDFYLTEIKKVMFYNKGLLSAGSVIFPFEFSFGKIKFVLNDGKKLITPNVENIKETYKSIINLTGLVE